MSVTNPSHTYEVRYYDGEQLALEIKDRGMSKVQVTRATSATRAISNVFATIIEESRKAGGSTSKRDFLILEAKVIAG
ncbi:hypothetical protein [Nocardia phage NC1]|nr:hypothetical protein [Nocardia phage NC1]QSL67713.1 hypothetical protein [Nocardia phage P69]